MKRWLVVVALLCACKEKDAPPPTPSAPVVELPKVAAAGTVEYRADGPVLAATPLAITIDTTQVVTLHDGVVDDMDREGGAAGRKIMKVTTRLAELGGSAPTSTLALSFAPRLSYGLLFDVLFSAKQREAGWTRFVLLVQGEHGPRALPITLPDKRPPPDLAAQIEGVKANAEPPLQMVVSVTNKDIRLWSMSRLEGWIDAPKLVAPIDANAAAKVEAALREIVQRRWPSQRPEDSLEIILMADPNTQVQTIAELIAAMRPAFPDVRLSTGFE